VAMAQAAHGSAPDIAGRDLANPIAMVNSSAMLLEWLGARYDDEVATRAAALVTQAVTDTVKGGVATRDLGGTASTSGFATAVVDAIGRP